MAAKYKKPGVYVGEISALPPSIAQVETAIPAFIGYTEKALYKRNDLHASAQISPIKIHSMLEYENVFGGAPQPVDIKVDLSTSLEINNISLKSENLLYHSMKMFFANGGTACYIVSIGAYRYDNSTVNKELLLDALQMLRNFAGPTLLAIPETVFLDATDAGEVHAAMLSQCNEVTNRFAILDLVDGNKPLSSIHQPIEKFRNRLGVNHLKNGAAYYPWLITNIPFRVTYDTLVSAQYTQEGNPVQNIASLCDEATLKKIEGAINNYQTSLPPSGAVAGVYCAMDRNRGVWKAPANVSLNAVVSPTVTITSSLQQNLNIDPVSGKSINAIRTFQGKGILVWGARTLAGNDNEWRYISVRRFCGMIEASINNSIQAFVFEPNDANTWTRVRVTIENFLLQQWRAGALVGQKADHAFFVRVGLGETMTAVDISEKRMIVEIGLAVVRPAEFIVLKFKLKMNS